MDGEEYHTETGSEHRHRAGLGHGRAGRHHVAFERQGNEAEEPVEIGVDAFNVETHHLREIPENARIEGDVEAALGDSA